MGKKKVKPNAFSVFMHEHLDKERRSGRKYPKEQWASIAKPHYDKLSADEKERYKQLAKTLPTRTVSVPAKFTSQGIPLEQVEREEREQHEKEHYMQQKVKKIVENAFLDNDIGKKPFIFIMANYFYKDFSGDYSPAELAVAKFSFEDGIYKSYHTFINPGTVAVGFAFEAKDHSEKSHRLPPPDTQGDAMGEKNYENIYSAMLDAIGIRPGEKLAKDNERRPCVFTRKQDLVMIESILDQISDQQWKEQFDVFELELLFNRLKNKVAGDVDPIRITVTNSFIEQDRYDATPNISCAFHEQEDATRYCALSYVRRWFYLFSDHVCEKINITLVPGKHLPSDALVGASQSYDPFEQDNSNNKSDHRSFVSSAYTGYSKFTNPDGSSSDDDY